MTTSCPSKPGDGHHNFTSGNSSRLCDDDNQSTQTISANNKNATNNVISHCNSTSSSSSHHPPANQKNNNNNETSSISPPSSFSDNYFSATDRSHELQCQQFNNTNCTDQYSITSSSYTHKRSIQEDTCSVDSCGTTARNAKKNKTNENNSARVRCLIFQFIFTNVLSISHCHFALFSRYFYKE